MCNLSGLRRVTVHIHIHSVSAAAGRWKSKETDTRLEMTILDEIAAVTASLGAARQAALSAELLSAVQNLANICERVLQPSRLLRLPPEMLLRVMRELDARTLANLGATMHNFPLLDCACDEAAEAQHGRQLAVLRPQRLSESVR